MSKNLRSWEKLPDTPSRYYGLATYNSKLALVGGLIGGEVVQTKILKNSYLDEPKVTNKVWLSGDGMKWKQSLPPMPTARHSPLATEIENSQCLVVVGGHGLIGGSDKALDVVEVLVQDQWATVQPLPHAYYLASCKPVIHGGKLYILTREDTVILQCKLSALLEAAHENATFNLWQVLIISHTFHLLASFGQRLVAIETSSSISCDNPYVMYAYSPTDDPLSSSINSPSLTTVESCPYWVHVEDLPVERSPAIATVIFEKFVLITCDSIYKCTLQGKCFALCFVMVVRNAAAEH